MYAKNSQKATIFVVPLRIASGTRFKILEAGAMAKPIVSTRIGAEGLDFQSGNQIIVEDNPVHFARAIADLLADSEMRAALGMKARDRVAREYSFKALAIHARGCSGIPGSTTVRQSLSRVRIPNGNELAQISVS
jgi:glycosyltransferase involved in cell wall biosynthesis